MKQKLLSAVICMCLAAGQAHAYDFASGGVYYNVLSNTNTRKTAAVTYATTSPDASGYISTYRGDVVIPSVASWKMETFNVTQIGDLAMFNNQSVYSVKLPEGITAIGSQAFSHCYSMTSITIPSTLTRIANYAFEYCEDLTSISLPANLGMIGDGVFQQCFGLQRIDVEEGNAEFKSVEGVLFSGVSSQSGMTLLVYPGNRPNHSFVVPEGTSVINTYALSANTTLKNLTLPASLKEIEEWAFMECAVLENFEVAEGNPTFSAKEGVLFSADETTLIQYPICRPATAYVVPEGVTRLGELAFAQIRALADLKLPSSLTTIDQLVFFANTGLTNVICSAVVPPTWRASQLVPTAGLFENSVYSQARLYVPAESIEAYKKAAGWREFAQILPIEEGVTSVEADDMTITESFDLQGRATDSSARGIVIERRGNTVTKVLRR